MKNNYISRTLLVLASLLFSLLVQADVVWIDVRSVQENQMDAIAGDINIPHDTIVAEVSKLYPDKNTEISVYCRSGGRAEKALKALQAAGYQQVHNAGGIEDARKTRGLLE